MVARKNLNNDLKAALLVLICLAINVLCSKIASWMGIPFYLDCIGTIAAAIVGGFLPGVLVAFFTNVINSIEIANLSSSYSIFNSNIYYGVVNVLIAICAAGFAQRGTLRKLSWKFIIPILYFTVIGGGIGSLISWGLYGNTLGEEVASSLANRIYDNVVSNAFFAQLYAGMIVDFPDKIISTIVAFLIYIGYPKEIRPRRNELDVSVVGRKGLSLSGKISLSVTLIFTAAAAVVSFVSFSQFKEVMIEQETIYAQDVASFAATLVDANHVNDYLFYKDSFEGYYMTKKYLGHVYNSSDKIQYLYVYQMQPDGCHVVFDIDTPDVPGSETGEVLPFEEGFDGKIDDLLAGNPIDPIITDDSFGWLLSAYVPIYDDNGKCQAYVCVDVSMPNIAEVELEFTFKITSLLLGFFLTVLTICVYLAKRFIVNPVNKLAKITYDFAYTNNEAREETLASIKELEIKTGDEIESLYQALAKTTRDTVDYISESQRKNEAIATFQSGMINVMADLVESRDKSTGTHIKNTAAYVEIICDQLIEEGLYPDVVNEAYKNNVVASAPMHDIGKIKVSDTILNKPGKFTDEEYEIMKTHAEEGAKIIASVKRSVEHKELNENYLGEAENMAHYHHEKWNGQGYPCGLKGEEIPLSARIMAVADVFDALVSKRVYKPGMPFEQAIGIIKKDSGSHFDPVVAEAFLHAEDKVRKVTEAIH
ncbi:MAG: HD domain-containing protein [Saccharofermentans sp.]|nr:HD domain-containing protein [Saccharofermentans sp.]